MSLLDGVRQSPPPVDEWVERGRRGSSLPPPGYIICQLRGPLLPPIPFPPTQNGWAVTQKEEEGGGKHHLAPTAHLARTLSKPFTVISHFHFSPFVRYNLKHRRRHSLLTVHSLSERSPEFAQKPSLRHNDIIEGDSPLLSPPSLPRQPTPIQVQTAAEAASTFSDTSVWKGDSFCRCSRHHFFLPLSIYFQAICA